MKNIYAFTDATPTSGYPAFISINETPEGPLSITVRSEDSQNPSEILLTESQARALYESIMSWLVRAR